MEVSKYNIFIDNEYVFNQKSQSILKLDKAIINLLKERETNKILESYDSEYITTLVDNGVINGDESYFLDKLNGLNGTLGFFLSMTSDCNLKCSYCYESVRTSEQKKDKLTLESWSEIRDYIIKEAIERNISNVSIALYGGEPLLNIDIIEKVIEDKKLFKSKNIELNLALLTNGVLLDDNRMYNIMESLELCQVTFDGHKELHDKIRSLNDSPTFDKIFDWVKKLSIDFENKIAIRINVSEINNSYYEMINQIADAELSPRLAALNFEAIFDNQSCHNPKLDSVENRAVFYDYINKLKYHAKSKGILIDTQFGTGTCLYMSDYAGCIDEKLNLYHCPGFLYSTPYANLRNDKDLFLNDKILGKCFLNCKYGAMCLGGCYWKKSKGASLGCSEYDYFEKYLERDLREYINCNEFEDESF